MALNQAACAIRGQGPLAAFRITEPRHWSREDWLSDLLRPLAFGIAATTTVAALRASARR